MNRLLLTFFTIGYAITIQAQSASEFLIQAASFKQKGNNIEAAKLLNKAFELDRSNLEIKKDLADILYLNKKYFDAIPLYEDMIKTDDKNVEYLARLSEMYSMSPRKQKGMEYADKVLKLKPTDANINKMIARAYFEVKYYPKAIEQYMIAEKAMPNDLDIPYKIGLCNRKLNKFYDAMIYYIKAMNLDPNNSNKIYEAANSCYDANNYKMAVELYQKAEDKGYFKSKAFYDNWAMAYEEMKDFEQAINCYMKAKEYSPFDKDITISLAGAYMKKGDFNKSREVLDEILKINPKDADVIYTKGMSYYKAGNTSRAEVYFNQAFDLDPSLKSLRYTKSNF
ncbi:MAG TPA: tetratricopeptide repeat protein [Chitinophagaceae bacterium]|nr:MAG: glycosyl transferase family protein [Bacteroidetes bacterium OLB11]HMN32162.1 tetratricopeptide repeat protein [Chitinophagaceae bacterium]